MLRLQAQYPQRLCLHPPGQARLANCCHQFARLAAQQGDSVLLRQKGRRLEKPIDVGVAHLLHHDLQAVHRLGLGNQGLELLDLQSATASTHKEPSDQG